MSFVAFRSRVAAKMERHYVSPYQSLTCSKNNHRFQLLQMLLPAILLPVATFVFSIPAKMTAMAQSALHPSNKCPGWFHLFVLLVPTFCSAGCSTAPMSCPRWLLDVAPPHVVEASASAGSSFLYRWFQHRQRRAAAVRRPPVVARPGPVAARPLLVVTA